MCNPEERIGHGGSEEVKLHPFFRGVQFDGLRQIRAPFEPRLTSNIDTTYFPTDELDQIDIASRLKAHIAQQAMNGVTSIEDSLEMSLPFVGYTFKRFDNQFR